MSVPAFIDMPETQQAIELRQFLRGLGSEIPEDNSEDDLEKDLFDIIDAMQLCWKNVESDSDIQSVYNSLISLILMIPFEKSEAIVTRLCDRLSDCDAEDTHSLSRLQILSNLFHGIDQRSPQRFTVYISLVKLAAQFDQLHHVITDLDQIKKWVAQWEVSTEKVQNLLRLLHDGFIKGKDSENATKSMLELLGTFTEETASQAKEDAHKCIVTCLADPNTFLMDNLLTLKPVQFLEGELIHLLTIFVSGKLSQYTEFYQNNADSIASFGLSHEENMKKMRLLTFMQMAETAKEIDLSLIQSELQLEADDVESFIIDVVRTKAVSVKIDQVNHKVLISKTTHRTFGRPQWLMLREKMDVWQQQLNLVLESVHNLTAR